MAAWFHRLLAVVCLPPGKSPAPAADACALRERECVLVHLAREGTLGPAGLTPERPPGG